MRLELQLIMGVVVGKHVEAVEPPPVVVMHQVVEICEVTWHTRVVAAEAAAEVIVVEDVEVVEVVEVVDVLDGAVEL
jgi:hypothetical protein